MLAVQAVAMQAVPSRLQKVRDINWANPDITRAGIIPIHYDGVYRWIGLGVSQYATTITAIGGSYEERDHDLLDTAIREYNEEVGPNMRKLVPESVVNCYAIKTEYTIQILLPVALRPIQFTPTEELNTILWVTPGQLQAMSDKQTYELRGAGQTPRAYSFAGQMQPLIIPLVEAVDSGIPFQLVSDNTPLIRPKQNVQRKEPRIITEIATLEQHVRIPGDFKGHIAVVLTPIAVGIMRADRTIYTLPLKDLPQIISILNQLGSRVTISTDTDRNALLQYGLNFRLSKSIEDSMNQLIAKRVQQATQLKSEFFTRLESLRNGLDRLRNELDLIWDYEVKAYELSRTGGTYFNERRACFLRTLNTINILLSRRPLSFMNLRRSIGDPCGDFNGVQIINTLINTSVLIQDKQTTVISIPQ